MRNTSKTFTVFFFLSSIAIIFGYVLEYFFNMLPCKLCTYERMIYSIGILLPMIHMIKGSKFLVYAMFCNYLVGVIISFYHIGLEFRLFHDVLGCTEKLRVDVSLEELKNNLLNPNSSPSCDRPHYLLGLSLATWNLVYLVIALLVSGKIYRGEREKS